MSIPFLIKFFIFSYILYGNVIIQKVDLMFDCAVEIIGRALSLERVNS